MNAPVNTNKKAALLDKVVEHVDITAYDARPVIDYMRNMSFTSRDTARAADILTMAYEDKPCSVWLTLAGSTSAAGCMHVYRDMVANKMIDAVVATGASIVDMDFFEALGFKHYQAKSDVDDRELRDLYIDRIYDTYIDEEELQNCDGTIKEIVDDAPMASMFGLADEALPAVASVQESTVVKMSSRKGRKRRRK